MITPFDIYLITIADNLRYLIMGVASFCFVIAFLSIIFWGLFFVDEMPYVPKLKKIAVHSSIVTICLFALAAAAPSSKALAAMYIIPAFDTKTIASLPQNAAKLANEWMKEKAKEIAENN